MKQDGTAAMTVLIVDDDAMNREILVDALRRRGYDCSEAEGGEAAIQFLKERAVDLVVTDIKMPKGDGLSLLRWIKATVGRTPAVFLMSGFADVSTPEALSLGAEYLAMKPIDEEALAAAAAAAKLPALERWMTAPKLDGVYSQHFTQTFASFAAACDSGLLALGQGGMFLALKSGFPLSYERIRFTLSFTAGPLRRLAGDGLVRWARPGTSAGLLSGIGIEFRSIEADAHSELRRYLQDDKVEAFLPLGKVSLPQKKVG